MDDAAAFVYIIKGNVGSHSISDASHPEHFTRSEKRQEQRQTYLFTSGYDTRDVIVHTRNFSLCMVGLFLLTQPRWTWEPLK